MARGGHAVSARAAYSALDRAALEAWASPGLVEHAARCADALAPRLVLQDQAHLVLEVAEHHVELPQAGLPSAWCTCPAWGPCRHVVAAVLHVIEVAPEGPSDGAPAPDVLDGVDLDAVRAWAGAKAYVDAWRLLLAGVDVEVELSGTQLFVAAPGLGAQARLVAGTGLAGLVVQAAARSKKRMGALALLAALRARGPLEPPAEIDEVDLSGATGAARTPGQIVTAVQDVLRSMLTVGLVHVSEASAERLFTASVSAQAAKLVRLGKGLAGLADEVRGQLRRHADADEARLFASMARVYALAAALEQAGASAPEALVGRARARYVDVPRLHLAGLGARRLRTESGALGLVTVFRDLEHGRWLSMADVRPAEQMPDFDPEGRFYAREIWGDLSFAALSRHEVRVEAARVSDDGRLSASTKTSAELLGPSPRSALDGIVQEDLQKALEAARPGFPLGLAAPAPHARLAVLAPARLGPVTFDPIAQTAVWPIEDGSGARVEVHAHPGPDDARLLRALEALRPSRGVRVLVELRRLGPRPRAHLVSVLTPGPDGLAVFSPSLEEPRGRRRPVEEARLEPSPSPPALDAARASLEGWAERGLTAAPPRLELPAAAARAAGLTTLADALERLSEAPSPHRLLVARWLLELSQRAVEG